MSRQKFVENFNLTPDTYLRKKVDMNEAVINVVEADKGTSYNALAVYTFPISRPDQRNLNNRIYTSRLWENVIRSGKAEGAFGLMDHPSEEGSTKDIWCVWRNLRFSADKKLILCDAYLFGHWGQQVLEALEAGGRVGLSSSGWGEFLADNTTLDPDTYEIERPADFVLNPSYEVFGIQDDLKESLQMEEDNTVESNLEISPKVNIKENRSMDTKKNSPSLEERIFERNMSSMMEDVKKIDDLQERIKENQTLLTYFDEEAGAYSATLKEQIESNIKADENSIVEGYKAYINSKSIIEEHSELTERVESLNKQIESLNESVATLTSEKETLTEEFENACELLDSMKEYTEKLNEMARIEKAKANSKISAKEYNEALNYSEGLEEENKTLKETIAELRRKVRSLNAALIRAQEDAEAKSEDDDDEPEDKKPAVKIIPVEKEPEDDEDEVEVEESFKGNPDVLSYYEDLEYRNPKVVKIKDEILAKKTLLEAQKTYLKLRALVEDTDTKLYTSGTKKYVESTKKEFRPLHEGWL